VSRRRRRTPEASSIESQWALVGAALGVVALIVAGVWWVLTPESQRYFECLPNNGVRNQCSNTAGGLAGPIVALVLGLMLLAIAGAMAIEGRWRAKAAQRRKRLRSRDRGAGHRRR